MQEKFGLQYELAQANLGVNATGSKPHYYSLNRHAENFGYVPALTSLQRVALEMEIILVAVKRGYMNLDYKGCNL
jgi:hypothetical protein